MDWNDVCRTASKLNQPRLTSNGEPLPVYHVNGSQDILFKRLKIFCNWGRPHSVFGYQPGMGFEYTTQPKPARRVMRLSTVDPFGQGQSDGSDNLRETCDDKITRIRSCDNTCDVVVVDLQLNLYWLCFFVRNTLFIRYLAMP